jgi:hypothetical protein
MPLSYLLVNIHKNRFDRFPAPERRSFGFRGCVDRGRFRVRLLKALQSTDLNYEYILNKGWYGRTSPNHPEVKKYEEFMIDHLFALCPRGTGIATIRFYEACFFERVPIVLGDNLLVGEDYYDMSFAFRISDKLSEAEIAEQLVKISEISTREAAERSQWARAYFDGVIRQYFKDPTLFFINFLNRHNLRY